MCIIVVDSRVFNENMNHNLCMYISYLIMNNYLDNIANHKYICI